MNHPASRIGFNVLQSIYLRRPKGLHGGLKPNGVSHQDVLLIDEHREILLDFDSISGRFSCSPCVESGWSSLIHFRERHPDAVRIGARAISASVYCEPFA
jgi:hypothetical protein